MSTDNDLFGPHPARATDPDTSHEAARRIARKRTPLQMRVLSIFAHACAPMTDIDLENLVGDHGSTYRTRASELTELKLLAVVGDRKQKGARRRLRAITPLGRAVFQTTPGTAK